MKTAEMGDVVKDFYKSDAPQFKGKSKEERREMAIAAKLQANEETVAEAAWTKKAGQNENGGLNEKGRKSYERENPGSDLKAPSKKVGNKRRDSFCARMKGMRKRQKQRTILVMIVYPSPSEHGIAKIFFHMIGE